MRLTILWEEFFAWSALGAHVNDDDRMQTKAGIPIEKHVSELVDLESFDPTMKLDVRYATENNFVGKAVYPFPKAYLQKPVAESLKRAHEKLRAHGYGILVFDGYRPWSVTKYFYEVTNDEQREFLANPDQGSAHNRGCAIDCSLFELATGKEVVMPSEFDEMNEKAFSDFAGGAEEARRLRDLLIETMHSEDFQVLQREWWHFNHRMIPFYPVIDLDFHELRDLLG